MSFQKSDLPYYIFSVFLKLSYFQKYIQAVDQKHNYQLEWSNGIGGFIMELQKLEFVCQKAYLVIFLYTLFLKTKATIVAFMAKGLMKLFL